MKPWPPELGGVDSWVSVTAYPPCAQLDENAASPLVIARSDPIADASLPDMRARRRPGTAIAAIMPMIATTISSSIRVKPLASRIFFMVLLLKGFGHVCPRHVGGPCHRHEQRECQTSSLSMRM